MDTFRDGEEWLREEKEVERQEEVGGGWRVKWREVERDGGVEREGE